MKLTNIKILHKIMICLALLAFVVGSAIWFATTRMKAIDDRYSEIIANEVTAMKAALRFQGRFFNFGRLSWRIIAETEMTQMKATADEIQVNRKDMSSFAGEVAKSWPKFGPRFERLLQAYDKMYREQYLPVEKATMANQNEDANRLARALVATTGELRDQARALVEEMERAMHVTADQTSAETASTITVTALSISSALVALFAVAFFIVQFGVAKPLNQLAGTMERLARGDLEAGVDGVERKDEVGTMARSVEVFKQNSIEAIRLRREQQEAEERAAEEKRVAEQREIAQQRAAEERAAAERKATMHQLADEFEKAVGGIIETVTSASTELEAAANTLTKTAETTQQLSTIVASASEEASGNVQSVASATEEMAGSVGEISRQVQESSTVAGKAVEQARRTDARITELSQAASRIGDVIKLITAIAEQTNLLALNATIEAARAGEAGKGFAVVAQEVKALAAQTAKATGEIGTQIAGMQTATIDSVSAIKEIGGTIEHISHIAGAIAAAVEEQGAATQEISRNVQEAAKGTTQVATNIVSVSQGASETGSASSQVFTSAQSLAAESNRLKLEVRKFLQTVRAA